MIFVDDRKELTVMISMDYRSITTSVALFFLLIGNAIAQDYAFKVLASKGTNTLDGQPIKVGFKITDNQTVFVPEGAYLSLAHHTGKAIEVAAGSHKVKDLSNKVVQQSSVTSKYAKFVVNELTQGEQSAAARNRFQHMNKIGSVERDLAVSSVRVWLPLNSTILSDQLLIRWSDVQPNESYEVQVSDLSDQLLYSSRTREQHLLLDLKSEQLSGQPYLIVKVIPVDQASGKIKIGAEQIDGNILVRPQGEALTNLQRELAEIRKEFGNNSAIGKLIEANFFEENDMIAEALNAYESALAISGQTPQYEEMYQAFLIRNAFKTANTATPGK
ncbi:hypothetical protein [Rhodoflexus sp.]